MRYVAVTFLVIYVIVLTKASANQHAHSHGGFESHSHGGLKNHADDLNTREQHGPYDFKSSANQVWMDTVSSVIGISLAPFILLLLVPDLNKHRELLKILLGFAAGGLLGDAFLHLIPHALSHTEADIHDHNHGTHNHSHSLGDSNTRVFFSVIGGIFGFLCIDKSLRFLRGNCSHSHSSSSSENGNKKQKDNRSGDAKNSNKTENKKGMTTAGYLNLAADFTHNFTDGIAIAGSFLISRNVGYITTLTVLIHELPHEIGDYAILIKSGCGVYRAMLLQLVTALGALIGASLSLFAAGVGLGSSEAVATGSAAFLSPDLIATCMLPFTAGGFIYIALASVLPDLLMDQPTGERSQVPKMSCRIGQAVAEIGALVLGVAMMALIGLFE